MPITQSLKAFLAQFKVSHEQIRLGKGSVEDREQYLQARDELAQMLCIAQKLTLAPGQKPRQAFRIALAYSIQINALGDQIDVVTLDISTCGFSALVDPMQSIATNTNVQFSMKPPKRDPITGSARVVDVKEAPRHHRLSFAFSSLPPAERDRLEFSLFDGALFLMEQKASR